jgi:hypothetical protein
MPIAGNFYQMITFALLELQQPKTKKPKKTYLYGIRY